LKALLFNLVGDDSDDDLYDAEEREALLSDQIRRRVSGERLCGKRILLAY